MTKLPHAKKSLGQNWLVNEGVLDRIVAAANIQPGETVLEVGPGAGALTKRLIETSAKIVAIEKDHSLIEKLREQFPSVEVIEGDILDFDPSAYNLEPTSCKILGNIPYYLTSHLIRRITEDWHPACAVLMVQYEVANRMLAKPPDMNLLALSVQLYAKPSLVMRVSRGSFRPIPTVDSAVIKLEPTKSDHDLNELILAIAKRAFGNKRKQLKFGPNPTARPQELNLDDWRKLAAALH